MTHVGINKTGTYRCANDWRGNGSAYSSPWSNARRYARKHGCAGVLRADGSLRLYTRDSAGKVRQRTYQAAQVRATTIDEPRMVTARNIVVGCLWHSSVVRHLVPADLWLSCYLACDGFGTITAEQAHEQCYDWSHVRDASEEAYRRVAGMLHRGLKALSQADRVKVYDLLLEHYGEPVAA